MRYVVFGAGRQGLAIAYDLARNGEAAAITLVEASAPLLRRAAARLRRLAPGVRVRAVAQAVKGRDVVALLRGHDAAVSALPYRLNPALTRAAVAARVPLCDLGGNTDLVREQLRLDGAARKAGITIVPDCGLAPGLANELAAIAVREVDGARHVRIRCGGLPVDRRGPLGYRLLFSLEGLTNEYTGESVVLREGRLRKVGAFTECETFRGPRSLGPLEAFHTSGGASTAPWTFRGRLATYEYKTVRYPGHFARMRAMIDLGLLDLKPVDVAGTRVVPRALFHAVAGPRLDRGPAEDLAFLRVDCTDDRGRGLRYEMLQHFDAATGFSAMEQTTGYPAAAIAHALARRRLPPGVVTPERTGLGADHVAALRRRGLRIRRRALTGSNR